MKCKLFFNLLALAFLASCGQKSLKPLDEKFPELILPTGQADINFCTMNPKKIQQKLKLLVVFDRSGSNVTEAEGRPATDPDKSRRDGSLINWLSQRQEDENEYYSLIEFSGNKAGLAPGIDASVDSPFIQLTSDYQAIIEERRANSPDNGGTPYKAALLSAIDVIRADARKAKERHEAGEELERSIYVIAFISDGKPTDVTSSTELISIIKDDFMKLPLDKELGPYIDPSSVLNTGYYYVDVDLPEARQVLKDMALAGEGEAFAYDQGTVIDFDQLTDVLIRKVTTKLTDIIVTNTNAHWDIASQTVMQDSDGDLLPDRIEVLLGSNPYKADSDDNGMPDGYEFMIDSKSRPCRDPQCNPARANKFTGCFEEDGVTLLDTDKDHLPNCAEKALGSDPDKFNTNGNGLTDHLAVKFGLPVTTQDNENQPSPPAYSEDADKDGKSDFREVQVFTSPLIKNSNIPNLKEYKYKQEMESYNPYTGVACYSLVVNDIYMFTASDNIRVHIFENETSQSGRKFLRTFDRQAIGGNVKFYPEDFEQ